MYKAKKDFLWYKEGQIVPDEDVIEHPNFKEFCIQSGSEPITVKENVKPEVKKDDFDFNNDGKVDDKDVSLAGKLLSKKSRSKKSKPKRK